MAVHHAHIEDHLRRRRFQSAFRFLASTMLTQAALQLLCCQGLASCALDA